MSSYPSEEGIVEYFEGLVEYMRKLGYEDPRDKRIAELEQTLMKVRCNDVLCGELLCEQCDMINKVLGGKYVN